jgi:hypothetical protein
MNVKVTICLGCLIWLYMVGMMGLLTPESHYFLIDFWVASLAIVIGFSEYSVCFYLCLLGSLDLVTIPVCQVYAENKLPQNAATSSTCMFVLTDICTWEKPSNSWLCISLWMLWIGYTFLVT